MEKFLARQPIFNSERDVYGYELLFRSGPQNFFDGSHPEAAAASAVDNLFLFGIDRLTHGRRAFINCTREFLLRDFPATLPADLSSSKSSRQLSRTTKSCPLATA